ncbi:MAG: hypothetical protein HZR80_02710 [Candidatus Heimdallarchaeota archaeon]
MVKRKKRLIDIVEELVPIRNAGYEGITSKELALHLGKSHQHISSLLATLRTQRKISALKERHSLTPLVTYYFKRSDSFTSKQQQTSNTPEPHRTCGKCQRYTQIGRCVLLNLVADKSYFSLKGDLLARWKSESLNPETPACEFFDCRVHGRSGSKQVNDFYKINVDSKTHLFLCPIKRCRKVITSLSYPFRIPKLGFSPIYCPYCGSPMVLDYNEYLNRLEVKYWDARYDSLQRDYRKITGKLLPPRKSAERFGISIHKDFNHFLDLPKEIIFIGPETTSEEDDFSQLIYFPLKELNYIAVNSLKDYIDISKSLHAEYEDAFDNTHRLYDKLDIFRPKDRPDNFPPSNLEIGGNEMIILSEYLNPFCLRANMMTRNSAIISSQDNVSSDLKNSFKTSSRRIKGMLEKYSNLTHLDFRRWQRIEGGCGSLMYEPFKLEARKYDFFAPARARARMVREDFLQYGLFYGRSDYHSAINGVNLVANSILKDVGYNQIQFAWDGLRGWCHQGYSLGLFYDNSEQLKTVTPVIVNQAIREGRLLPSYFVERRGKRYDKLNCIESGSEGESIIRKMALEVLNTKVCLEGGSTITLVQVYKKYLRNLQELLNELPLSSSSILLPVHGTRKKISPWRMLQQVQDWRYITQKEFQIIKQFVQDFLMKDFVFEPLTIIEIN